MKRINFLNVIMDSATMAETVSFIASGIKSGKFLQHVVVNVAKIVNAQKDSSLMHSIESCDLINIDGMGVVWGARFCGYDVPERVAGIDLFYELLVLSQDKQYPVFLLGAEQLVLDKTVEVLQKAYPSLIIAGSHHGYFDGEEQRVVNMVSESKAKLLFVAMGSPQKEKFIERWKHQLNVNFAMGVGGTFDVVAGKVNRAPLWMQNSGLEWLYRLLQEPSRMWRRYIIGNAVFALMLLVEKGRYMLKKRDV